MLEVRVLVVSGRGPFTLDQMCGGPSGYHFENDGTQRRERLFAWAPSEVLGVY